MGLLRQSDIHFFGFDSLRMHLLLLYTDNIYCIQSLFLLYIDAIITN